MTDEIIKLYENAGVEKQEPLFCEYFNYSSRDLYERCTRFHKYCADGHFGMKEMCPCGLSKSEREDMFKYPPFTAEKQLSLIKWLSEQYTITTRYMTSAWFITAETSDVTRTVIKYTVTANTFEETIASAINYIWSRQDLTSEEKEQIRGILNG